MRFALIFLFYAFLRSISTRGTSFPLHYYACVTRYLLSIYNIYACPLLLPKIFLALLSILHYKCLHIIFCETMTPKTAVLPPKSPSAKAMLNAGKNDMINKTKVEDGNDAVELDERGLRVASIAGKKVHVCCAQYFDDERQAKRSKHDGDIQHHPLCTAHLEQSDGEIPELVYFDGPGRAELIRLVLHAGGVAFRDRRVSFREFVAMKGDPSSLPMQRFGSVPILFHDGMVLAQSIAIQQYASDLAFAERNTIKSRAIDMMYAATHAEVQTAMYACLFGTEEAKRKARENLPIVVEKFLGSMEAMLPQNGDFIHLGDAPSLADLSIFDLCTSKFPGLFMLGEDISQFPRIVALLHKIRQFEPLKFYLSERGF